MKQKTTSITALFSAIILFFASCQKSDNLSDSAPPPDAFGYGCEAPGVTVNPDHSFDGLFNGATNELSGGGLAGSLAIPGGDTLWFVYNGLLTTSGGGYLLHNCVLRKNGAVQQVKFSSGGSYPESLIPDPGPGLWYTINNGIIYNGKLELIVSSWQQTGPGYYDFVHTGVSLAVVDTSTYTIESMTAVTSYSDILLGAGLLRDQGYIYIYGSQNTPYNKLGYLARVPAGSLQQPWSYYTGSGWSNNIAYAVSFLDNIGEKYSVFAWSGRYYLVTQGSDFDDQVNIYYASSPQGAWQYYKTLFCWDDPTGGSQIVNTLVHFLPGNGNQLICAYSRDSDPAGVRTYPPTFIDIGGWQ